jgi:hypothetical protein
MPYLRSVRRVARACSDAAETRASLRASRTMKSLPRPYLHAWHIRPCTPVPLST